MRSVRSGHRMRLVMAAALAIGLHGEAEAQDRKAALLLTNVRIFDGSSGRFAEPQDLLIRDGRIAQVGAVTETDAFRIDAGGAYALPGLWDSHVHLTPLTMRGGDT